MLNEQIRELRNIRGISQIQLANKLGVTKQSVSNWENDNILPSIEMLVKIANFFEVSTDYLLGLDKKPVIFARGFTNFKKRMYPQQYDKFMTTLILHFGRNQYFKRRRGDILLPPEEQEYLVSTT